MFQEQTSKTGKASGFEATMSLSALTVRAPIADSCFRAVTLEAQLVSAAVQASRDKRTERHDALISEFPEIKGVLGARARSNRNEPGGPPEWSPQWESRRR